jgi:N-acetylmuramoyl-L-alanine amidase
MIMQVDYKGAIPMFVDRSRVFQDAQPSMAIVIHKTAGFSTIEQLGNYFASTSLVTSSHYGVGLDGRVAQFVSENDGAAANCCLEDGHDIFWNRFTVNLNRVTFSIEHIDPSLDNSTTPTNQQLYASFRLVADIARRKGIPVTSIKTHASLEPQSRARCPGNYPFDSLIEYVRSSMIMPKALTDAGWTDDGKVLKSPDGKFPIVLGMRDFILDTRNKWNPNSWAISTEVWSGMVEESNPSIGSGAFQLFLYDRLCYRKDDNVVYRAYIGKELLWWMNKP